MLRAGQRSLSGDNRLGSIVGRGAGYDLNAPRNVRNALHCHGAGSGRDNVRDGLIGRIHHDELSCVRTREGDRATEGRKAELAGRGESHLAVRVVDCICGGGCDRDGGENATRIRIDRVAGDERECEECYRQDWKRWAGCMHNQQNIVSHRSVCVRMSVVPGTRASCPGLPRAYALG